MRIATSEEIERITASDPVGPSPVLTTLLSSPRKWWHISREECSNPENLEAEADFWRNRVRTVKIAGHRDGGFFAIALRQA